VRVGLLELVDRPVHHELSDLLLGGVPTQVRRQSWAVIGVDQSSQLFRDRLIAGTEPAIGFQPVDPGSLQLGAEGNDVRIPLAIGVHVVEAAILQLVGDPKGQL
jgi:hypothetical protein